MNTKIDKIDDTIIVTVTLPLVVKSVSKETFYKNDMVKLLREHEELKVELTGYTFTSGNTKINNYESHVNVGTYVFTKTATSTAKTTTTTTTTATTTTTETTKPTTTTPTGNTTGRNRKKRTQK